LTVSVFRQFPDFPLYNRKKIIGKAFFYKYRQPVDIKKVT
jgi:hypothetical protein